MRVADDHGTLALANAVESMSERTAPCGQSSMNEGQSLLFIRDKNERIFSIAAGES